MGLSSNNSANGPVTPGNVATDSSLIGGQFNTTPPTVANGQQVALQIDSSGKLIVSATSTVTGTVTANQGTANTIANGWPIKITDGTNTASVTASSALKIDGSAVTQPISGTITSNQGTSPWVTNVSQFGGNNVVTGTGTSGVGIPRITVSNDSNILATQSGTWTVQPGNTANTTPWLVTDSSDGPVTPGTVTTNSSLAGGQFNTTLPTLTNTQQAALQVDSRGRLLTSTNIGSIASTVAPSLSDNIKAEATFTVIAIPSSVTYTTLYTYSGSGYFLGFNYEFNNTNIVIKLVIDGKTVFDGFDISQYNSLAVTTNASTRYQSGEGIVSSATVFDYSTRYPIAYTSSVVISARLTSGAVSKNFTEGMVYIQKDT